VEVYIKFESMIHFLNKPIMLNYIDLVN